jgi:pimeloyl-ACP methyl ester carboxylesterase
VRVPETRYSRSGDVSIAFQVLGSGPFDVVVAPGAVSHVELLWEVAGWAAWLRGVASQARVVVFDQRGTGMSDRIAEVPTLEERSDDIRAVMDAAGSGRAALAGFSEGVPMSVVFAASCPERVSALVLCGGMARTMWAADYLFGDTERAARQEVEEGFEQFLQPGGPEAYIRTGLARGDAEEVRVWARVFRYGASPGAWEALDRMNRLIESAGFRHQGYRSASRPLARARCTNACPRTCSAWRWRPRSARRPGWWSWTSSCARSSRSRCTMTRPGLAGSAPAG